MSYKRLVIPAVLLVALIAAAFLLYQRSGVPVPSNNQQNLAEQQQQDQIIEQQPGSLNKKQHSLDEPGSIWQVVNKKRPLPGGYIPFDLIVPDVRLRLAASEEQMKFRKIAEPELIEMFRAAQADGVTLVFGSGYRSYGLQKKFYDGYVARDGQAAADRYSARPGTSEHQTGLSFDVTSSTGKCHLEVCFENMVEGQWVKVNAYKYGFIIRYQSSKEAVTGYQYEPWHLRYVGKELAAELNKTGQTLEEFFSLI